MGERMIAARPSEGDVLSTDDLRRLTDGLVERLQRLLRGCHDADVVFVPHDPLADDPYAELGHEANVGWTVGHIIVHLTATAEESAALAAELARGVPYHGRSRREAPWQEVTRVAQCRARLEESRRLCIASLGMWPSQPDLSNTYIPWEGAAPMGALARYLLGLQHADAHIEQVRDVLAQARAERRKKTWWRRSRARRTAARQPRTAVVEAGRSG